MGSPQNTASTIRLPTNNPRDCRRDPQLNTAHHGRTTTVTYPPRTPAHGRHAPAAHGVGHQSYGGHSVGETPGPIPNPEAKTRSADGTAPGRVWESRTPPDHTPGTMPPHPTVRGHPTLTTPPPGAFSPRRPPRAPRLLFPFRPRPMVGAHGPDVLEEEQCGGALCGQPRPGRPFWR